MERHKRRGTRDGSPLILIVILVYAAFLVTAFASIAVFFPQAGLTGSLRPLSSLRALRAPAPEAPRQREPAETGALAGLASGLRSRMEALQWPRITLPELPRVRMPRIAWPDVGGWLRRAVASVRTWLADLEVPDVARLWERVTRGRSRAQAPPQPPPVALPRPEAPRPEAAVLSPPSAPPPQPAAGAAPAPAPQVAVVERVAAAQARTAPDAEALRLAYEARLQAAEDRRAREVAAAAAEAARRYNPVLTQPALADALRRSVNRGLFGRDVSAPYRDVLASEGIATREQYERLRARAAELDLLAGRLLQIPYTNSVPPALERIRDAGQTLALEYGRIWSALAERLETRDRRIADLESRAEQFALAMDSLARRTREGGYVLDPRDPQAILLYVSRIHAPRVGDTVYVFRSEDELLATLRITAVGDSVRASLVEQGGPDKPIAAFDRILVAAAEETRG